MMHLFFSSTELTRLNSVLQFASRISGMRFCEASAKDNFNVDEIFLKLVDDILSKVGEFCL